MALRPRLATGLPLIDPVAHDELAPRMGKLMGERPNATRYRTGSPVTNSGSEARPDGLWRTAPHATDVTPTAIALRSVDMVLVSGPPDCGHFH